MSKSQRRTYRLQGARTLLLLPLLLTAAALIPAAAEAQRTVMVHQEPRHRLVHDDGDIKLLDVQLLPGDTTLNHTHDSPILYTYINLGRGSQNGRVQANMDYLNEPYTHNVTNGGDQLFRIIAMAHYGQPEADSTANRPDGITATPTVENNYFRSYRLELGPGQTTPLHRHRNDVAVVLVTDGRAEVSKENGFGAELEQQGAWTWREAESGYTITNPGSAPIVVVVNEGRRAR
jgi:quercetin dioxygenase-like cupin family protein